MAEVEGVCIDDMEYGSTEVRCRQADLNFPAVHVHVDPSEGKIHKVDIMEPRQSKGKEWKKKYSKEHISLQKKKELYTKLDEILLVALREEFEVCPGHSVDRLEMIEFLTSVVQRHLIECPDLKKVLDLRDTVLTGRVKKAFPEVEFKRKQIRREYYRKVWIYVNIRRKLKTPTNSPAQTNLKTIPRSWKPLAPTSRNQTSVPTSSPLGEDQTASLCSFTNASYECCHSTPLDVVDQSVLPSESSPESVSGFDGSMPCLSGQHSYEIQPSEGSGLLLDNLAMQRWVLSHYVQDDLSYVPVQDVVKAFKEDFSVDLSYKECHQVISSTFTTPKNRLISKKTVRVSTLGQQYVYRGIAPVDKPTSCASVEAKGSDESESMELNSQSESGTEHFELAWKQKIRDIIGERDQALMERNQALAALMELETKHEEAIQTIDKLRKETLVNTSAENSTQTLKETPIKEGFCIRSQMQKCSGEQRDGKRDIYSGVARKDADTNLNDKQCDWLLLKEVVTQSQEERDCLLKRLEIVKNERNSYLDRLHSLEKENQRLKDAVSLRHSEPPKNQLLEEISRHFQANFHGENSAKEALSSVLSHLKSKRKQVSPSRLTKSPKYENSNLNELHKEQNSLDKRTRSEGFCASAESLIHSVGVPSPGNLTSSNGVNFFKKDVLCNGVSNKISNNSRGNYTKGVSRDEEQESKDDLLVFTSGSGMIGFTRHPLED